MNLVVFVVAAAVLIFYQHYYYPKLQCYCLPCHVMLLLLGQKEKHWHVKNTCFLYPKGPNWVTLEKNAVTQN